MRARERERARELLAEKIAANSEKVSAAFLRFDKDRSGRLTPGEMRRARAVPHRDGRRSSSTRSCAASRRSSGRAEDEISYADFLKAFATFRPNHVPVPWGATRVPAELAHEYVDGSVGAMLTRRRRRRRGRRVGQRHARAAGGDHGKSFSGAAAHALAAVDPEDAARRAAAEAERARAPPRAAAAAADDRAAAAGATTDGVEPLAPVRLARRHRLRRARGRRGRARARGRVGRGRAAGHARREARRALGGGVAQVRRAGAWRSARRARRRAAASRPPRRAAPSTARSARSRRARRARPSCARPRSRARRTTSAPRARARDGELGARRVFNLQVDAPPRLGQAAPPAAPASAPTPVPSTAAEPLARPAALRGQARARRDADPGRVARAADAHEVADSDLGYCPTTGARLSKPKPQKTDVPKTAEKYARPYADRVRTRAPSMLHTARRSPRGAGRQGGRARTTQSHAHFSARSYKAYRTPPRSGGLRSGGTRQRLSRAGG